MSSQWTNKFAIMRDLSLVQGCVPVDIDGTVAAGDRPPALDILEETEEEFFRNCTTDGEVAAPDFGLIKHMLDMVRDLDVSSDIDEEDKCIQISKLNPNSQEFLPKTGNGDAKPRDKDKQKENKPRNGVTSMGPKKKRGQRNVAVNSLLKSIADAADLEKKIAKEAENDILKLRKPDDFILSGNMTESLKKVNGWFDAQELPEDCVLSKRDLIIKDPASMFKRKKVKSPVKSPEPQVQIQSPSISSGQYVPSIKADEYYQKYLERSKVQQIVQEDIWSKAERQMKELDARKLEAKQSQTSEEVQPSEGTQQSLSSPVSTSEVEDKRLDMVRLPQHRHLLTGECVVCKVLCKTYQSVIVSDPL